MQASTFTSKLICLALVGGSLLCAPWARAQDASASPSPSQDRTQQPEEEDFTGSAYTNYGEFSEEDEEAEDLRFFQYGRLFGVSLGLGYQGASGNRGNLWQGGGPAIDFKVHYWFDFNFALDIALFSAPHYYEMIEPNAERREVRMVRLGLDVKYYFDTKDLSSAISFSNPYILMGVGSYTKTETSIDLGGEPDEDSKFGFNVGLGFDFPIKPKKAYFSLEGRLHSVTFEDTRTGQFIDAVPNLPDLTGYFYTFGASVLFTW